MKVDDGVTGYINNASVMTSGDGSYGISVDSQNKVLYISDSNIKTSGSVSDKENGGITASAVVSEFGGTIVMNGDNSVETRGIFSGILSQVNDSGTVENNTSLETTDKTKHCYLWGKCSRSLACSSPGESRTCVDAVDDEVCDSNSYEVISRADLKMNGGSITTNGINSYGAYANGKKAYINLDYVVLETVADGSYAVAIRQGNIDIKKFYYNKWH